MRNILKEEGIKPRPDRISDSWTGFLKRHGETLWACDFFSVKSVTAKGIRDLYVLVYLCVQTREVIVTEATEHPTSAWACLRGNGSLNRRRPEQPNLLSSCTTEM